MAQTTRAGFLSSAIVREWERKTARFCQGINEQVTKQRRKLSQDYVLFVALLCVQRSRCGLRQESVGLPTRYISPFEPEPCRSSAACPRATVYSALSRSPSHCHVVVLNSDRSAIVDAEIMEQLESEELPWCYEPVGRQHVGV